MKAAILKEFGQPLSITETEDPSLGTGEVIVEVKAAPIVHYTKGVLSGERNYLLDLPQIPGAGAVGKVLKVGPDATKLKKSDWVFCDPTVRARDDARTPDINLQGWSARGDGGLQLQQHYRNGSFAEQMRVPTENAIPLGKIKPEDAEKWCAMIALPVPFGGLLSIDLKAGETIVISGSTGFFGSAAVAMALAMGAGTVIAPGRNQEVLKDLVNRFGDRVVPVTLTGEEETDREAIQKAVPQDIDCVLDILPPSAPAKVVRTAIMTVREYGRIALMGGVGWDGNDDLEIPYRWMMRNSVTIKGQWMYKPEACTQFVAMAKAGLISLDEFEFTAFGLDDINEAVEYADRKKGAFKLTVLKP